MLSVTHSGTLACQYRRAGADGKRRWAKDIANNAWTWYPCGVACGAGELLEQGSDLTGTTWTTNAQYLRAGSACSSMLIRRKSSTDDEYDHVDPLGVSKLVTGANAVTSGIVVADYFSRQIVTTGLKSSPYDATNLQAISQAGYLTTSRVYYAERSVCTKYRNPVDCLIDEINCLKQSQH